MSRERGAGSGTARCASSRRAAYASHVVRQRLATIRGATRTPTTRVGQPSAVTARARPAAVPPVPSRSEERRVGKEWRARRERYHKKKNNDNACGADNLTMTW